MLGDPPPKSVETMLSNDVTACLRVVGAITHRSRLPDHSLSVIRGVDGRAIRLIRVMRFGIKVSVESFIILPLALAVTLFLIRRVERSGRTTYVVLGVVALAVLLWSAFKLPDGYQYIADLIRQDRLRSPRRMSLDRTLQFTFAGNAVRRHEHERVPDGPRQQAMPPRPPRIPVRPVCASHGNGWPLCRVSHQFDPRDEPALANLRDGPPSGASRAARAVVRKLFDLPAQPCRARLPRGRSPDSPPPPRSPAHSPCNCARRKTFSAPGIRPEMRRRPAPSSTSPPTANSRRSDPFARHKEIGQHVLLFTREHRARAPEPGHHLVGNEQHTVTVAPRAQFLQCSRRPETASPPPPGSTARSPPRPGVPISLAEDRASSASTSATRITSSAGARRPWIIGIPPRFAAPTVSPWYAFSNARNRRRCRLRRRVANIAAPCATPPRWPSRRRRKKNTRVSVLRRK